MLKAIREWRRTMRMRRVVRNDEKRIAHYRLTNRYVSIMAARSGDER